MTFEFSSDFALSLDEKDTLSSYRKEFLIPPFGGKESVYFTGNSLGLQPRAARTALGQELDDWEKYGVEGHFEAKNPWYAYHEMFAPAMSKLVGAKENEVVAMNGLTVNLHLLMVTFFRPTSSRYKILCEAKAFPSDQYALESQLRFHGLDPDEALVEVAPREGEHLIREEDVLEKIRETGDALAMVMIGGVNYYTGQFFDLESIAKAGHAVGAMVGFDLAHAAGNVPLKLHDWQVDFAAWCSYKYMNAGPGSVSGAFVHEKHATNTDLPRFAGWWGHDKSSRFLMQKGFKAMPTAEAWQLSNAPVLSMAVYKVSLDLFEAVGMEALRSKSLLLTDYLEFVINEVSRKHSNANFEIITPEQQEKRGCQLSILAHGQGKGLFDRLTEKGVIADWREPNVIRIAPVPLYNSFEDVYRFGKYLDEAVSE